MARNAQPQRTIAGKLVSGKFWGITKPQVRQFFAECRQTRDWSDADSIRETVQKFVKPQTRGLGMGLALALNREDPKEVNVMVSHSWDENALRFAEDLELAIHDDEIMFICFFALYQCEDGAGPSIGEQLGSNIYAGPFAEVIENLCAHGLMAELSGRRFGRARGRMVIVTNSESALYCRLWCVWEAYIAITRHVPTIFTRRGRLFQDSLSSSKEARCGDPKSPCNEDERMIRAAIEQIPVETWRSVIGGGTGVVAVLAAITVPLGLSFGWALGLGIAGGVVAVVSRVVKSFTWLLLLNSPPAALLSQFCAWVAGHVSRALLVGSGVSMFALCVFILICLCCVSRRRIAWSGRFTAGLADRRDGYSRLDAVVRRAAAEC